MDQKERKQLEQKVFDMLVARRAQREAAQLKVGEIHIPESEDVLQVRMPSAAKMLDFFGRFALTRDPVEMLNFCAEALYHCCGALQDKALHEAIGVKDPLDVVPALFGPGELNLMGQELLQFLGLVSADDDEADDNPAKN